jgi:predicted DNA-binding helix-hairpin-helix protein
MTFAVRIAPDARRKLALLGQAAQYDLACACGKNPPRVRSVEDRWLYPAALPGGGTVTLLKILQQGGCERNCAYCAQRCGGAGWGGETSFAPEDLARLFIELRDAGRAEGLFLSSALRGGGAASMDRMLATAEELRKRHRFRGYLHLKLIPGCRADQVERAMELATRVSVNLEAPTAEHLGRIAPMKRFDAEIMAPLRQVARAAAEGRYRKGGMTTQFVVGAAGETDRELGLTAARLYREYRLARVYFSAFQPAPGTPLADRPAAPLWREHRLYQLDFLLRKYKFGIEEIPFDAQGGLSKEADPKSAWARAHPERFPIEVNTASPEELLRVPGIGPISARRIMERRRTARLRTLAALRGTGALADSAAPFVLLDGRAPAQPRQLPLFV